MILFFKEVFILVDKRSMEIGKLSDALLHELYDLLHGLYTAHQR